MLPKAYTAPPYFPPMAHSDNKVMTLPVRAHYQVRPYTCGFASVLTVLHTYRRSISERDLYRSLGTDSEGTSQAAIIRELRRADVGAGLSYDLDFPKLRRTLDAGKLIIAYHHPLEHWVVVYGYGRDPERVFVADSYPSYRNEHTWAHYGPKMRGFGIVCSRRKARRVSARHASLVAT